MPIHSMLRTLESKVYDADERLVLIHGGCQGADLLAAKWAEGYGNHLVDVLEFIPDWVQYGSAAGPIRNQRMLDQGRPDLVLAFRSNGKSRGTDDMIQRARMAGVPVYVVTKPSAL